MTMRISWPAAGIGLLLAACAHQPPPELVEARTAFEHASTGPAATLAPHELAVARDELARAENAFATEPGSPEVRDHAYAAQSEALAATAAAGAETARRNKSAAEAAIAAATAANRERALVAEARAQTEEERARAASTARSRAEAETEAERAARFRTEEQSLAAMRRLEEQASVRQEARGRVITLSGSVLFTSGTATLLPSARRRLDDVAAALSTEPKAQFIIEGYTDSRRPAKNLPLSQARADAVRDYLVERGVDPARTFAIGKGARNPIASNTTAEGRANNRRVEIIINRRQALR
jgi:outer membrane protein OmpA-like peptidoglycan-associated protein